MEPMSNPPSLSISEYGLISPSGFLGGTFLNWTAVKRPWWSERANRNKRCDSE